jgi:hypothetical protein
LVGWQASPAVHPTQTPALQTMFVPHDVPLATSADSVQTTAPVVHETVPVRHGFPVIVQLEPGLHAIHAPALLQTMSVPQLVPAATFVFLSVQVGVPVEHASAPAWHLFVGVQAAPS